MKEAAKKEKISITELYEWPIFNSMREHEDFEQWVQDAFGYKLGASRLTPRSCTLIFYLIQICYGRLVLLHSMY